MPRARFHAVVTLAGAISLAGSCGGRAGVHRGATVTLRLPSLDGGEVDLAALRGRVVVLHLFDSGAPAAIADAGTIEQARRREGRRVSVVAIAFDRGDPAPLGPWRRALGIGYVVVLADDDVRGGTSPLGPVRVLPSTLVLDADGRIAARLEGGLGPGQLDAAIDAALDR